MDIAFHDADVHDALRFLADAARINLVVDPDVAGRVSLRLLDVDPIDVLVAIAEAHGARVEHAGSVTIVTRSR